VLKRPAVMTHDNVSLPRQRGCVLLSPLSVISRAVPSVHPAPLRRKLFHCRTRRDLSTAPLLNIQVYWGVKLRRWTYERDVSKTVRPPSSGSRSPRNRGDCLTFDDNGNRNRRNVANCSPKVNLTAQNNGIRCENIKFRKTKLCREACRHVDRPLCTTQHAKTNDRMLSHNHTWRLAF
jgi:hypothetical protein